MLPTTKVTEIPVAAAELEKLAAPIVHLKGFASRLLLRGVPVPGPPHAFDVDEETARTEAAVERPPRLEHARVATETIECLLSAFEPRRSLHTLLALLRTAGEGDDGDGFAGTPFAARLAQIGIGDIHT